MLFSALSYGISIESSFEAAHAKAVQTNRELVVFLTRKKSKTANKILIKLLHNRAFGRYIEKEALFVIVVEGKSQSYPIEMLYTLEYPTLFFLDKNELFSREALQGESAIEAYLERIGR